MISNIKSDFEKYQSKKHSQELSRFFKTEKGEYGYGDIFIGINNPDVKILVKKYKTDISLEDTLLFLEEEIHEYRAFALEILKYKYKKGNEKVKKQIVQEYIKHIKYINNWDLVDCSAPHILGDYLLDKDRSILYKLANTNHLWSQRISILSTFAFIKANDFKDTIAISKLLLSHKHDLMHKAVGWMLREVWKRDTTLIEKFIIENYKRIPRTALRYAIEKIEESKRREFLKGNF